MADRREPEDDADRAARERAERERADRMRKAHAARKKQQAQRRKAGATKNTVLTARVSPPFKEEVEQFAATSQIEPSALIRMSLVWYMDHVQRKQ